jgi:hypothetical protein
MLPLGTRSDALCAPFSIWSNTGSLGGSKVTPFMRNLVESSLSECVNDHVLRLETGAYELDVEIDVDVSTTREGFTGLDDIMITL